MNYNWYKSLVCDQETEEKLMSALVVDSVGGEMVFIEDPANSDLLYDLKDVFFNGRRVVFDVFDNDSGVHSYTGTVTYCLGDKFHIGNLVHLGTVQRRNDIKILIEFSSEINCITPEHEEVFEVQFKDISAGGVRFECFEELNLALDYEFVFSMGSSPVLIQFKILHKSNTRTQSFAYGCQFVNVSKGAERVVREFVFKSQGLIRIQKKEREARGIVDKKIKLL